MKLRDGVGPGNCRGDSDQCDAGIFNPFEMVTFFGFVRGQSWTRRNGFGW
jgi:hypothetical protein